MSDGELSDDMQELNELIAEYRSKEEEGTQKDNETVEDINRKDKQNNDNQSDVNEKVMEFSMDKVIFGDKAKLIKNLEKAVTKASNKEKDKNATQSENYEEKVGDTKSPKKVKKRKPAWADADDEIIQLGEVKRETKRSGPLNHLKMDKTYKEYLTTKFTRIVSQPKWASIDEANNNESEEDSDGDKELLRTVGFLNKPSSNTLTPGHLSLKRMKDLNRATYSEGYVNSIQFHPTSTAALVAGDRGVATIYAIDGTQNDKLHNIHIPNFPIRCAKILPCGTKAIFGSVTRYAYLYDLMNAKETCFKLKKEYGNLCNFVVSPCGRYVVTAGLSGEIHIYEAKTFEIIRTLKQNDDVAALQFTSDSQKLIVSGQSSNIYIFSMRQQKLEHKFVDDGCIRGRVMNLSPNQRLLATGSNEGVVNVYDFDKVMLSNNPKPEKSFLNLTTSISSLRFNHSSELLAFSSNLRKDGVKIAHFPSATVYSNFPGNMPKIGFIRTLEFSPQSAYFAMGTIEKCPLYRIKHFNNY